MCHYLHSRVLLISRIPPGIVHRLLIAETQPEEIGIITFYPHQVEIYRGALKICDTHRSHRGYEKVKVNVVENCAGQTVDFAIVDLVRTTNARGNLGLLSQQRRLKIALTRHKNGLS